jgi:hypothetical protein
MEDTRLSQDPPEKLSARVVELITYICTAIDSENQTKALYKNLETPYFITLKGDDEFLKNTKLSDEDFRQLTEQFKHNWVVERYYDHESSEHCVVMRPKRQMEEVALFSSTVSTVREACAESYEKPAEFIEKAVKEYVAKLKAKKRKQEKQHPPSEPT